LAAGSFFIFVSDSHPCVWRRQQWSNPVRVALSHKALPAIWLRGAGGTAAAQSLVATHEQITDSNRQSAFC
jgi:hypothetical protein